MSTPDDQPPEPPRSRTSMIWLWVFVVLALIIAGAFWFAFPLR
mgnify:CR=1 FL=1